MKICSACGEVRQPGARYCSACGHSFFRPKQPSGSKAIPLTVIGTVLTVTAVIGIATFFRSPDTLPASIAKSEVVPVVKGDSSTKGGTATVRVPYTRKDNDPATTNDESNDQPIGHYGRVTLQVYSSKSANHYRLDADVEEGSLDAYELTRLYFPKGGWIDFPSCDLDEDYEGECADENYDHWHINGE